MAKCPSCSFENSPGTSHCERCSAQLGPGGAPGEVAGLEQRLRSLLEQGQKIEAIKLHREATGASLAEAKSHVDALEAGGSTAPQELRAFKRQLLELLKQGQKIQAIKLYREKTGKGLKESKDAVEDLAAQHDIASRG